MSLKSAARIFLSTVMLFFVILSVPLLRAQESPSGEALAVEGQDAPAPGAEAAVEPVSEFDGKPIDELVRMAWAASARAEYAGLEALFSYVSDVYGTQARQLHASLTGFPPRDKVAEYNDMNQVAVLHFIRAEAQMHQGKSEEALASFEEVIRDFPYAQAWDASRGSFWSVAEKSQDSIYVITGVDKEEVFKNVPATVPKLAKPGAERVVDFTKYGEFTKTGTCQYRYQVKNQKGLARALGEGIYPNTGDILKNPNYKKAYLEGRMSGSHWDFTNSRDLEAAFFKWAGAPEPWGVKLYYIGAILERAGMYLEAIKAYHALIVQFPDTTAWTYWQTPWYPAQAAVGKIRNILRMHPELGLAFKGGKIRVVNGYDKDAKNDIFVVEPGEIVRDPLAGRKEPPSASKKREEVLGKPVHWLGGKKVYFGRYRNGHWRMFVDGKPFMIKGMTYSPTKVGQSPDKGTLANWTLEDTDGNGKIDGPYDAWVDKNGNNLQDKDEPTVGDFALLKDMGVNTIRYYHQPYEADKGLFRDLYSTYGIRVMMGDFLGKYTLGSGADWTTGTDYTNPEHQKKMMESVETMVREYKDEPFLLMWLLGNENVYGVACNADKNPEAFFKFVNKVAKRIKELDPDHPVGIANGDVLFIDKLAGLAPEIDLVGGNVYRGDYGFGAFWDEVRMTADRPAFISEFGAPGYGRGIKAEEIEGLQAAYHRSNWLDIDENSAGKENGEGNAVGGVVFEWLDEWHKNYEPYKHDIKADVIGPFAGGYYYEEWFGIAGQGDGSKSPFMRQLRQAYYVYKELWN
jgi:beta-glucuronidase